jgi:pimeloyl-ACP methyl ester carboxylesterase
LQAGVRCGLHICLGNLPHELFHDVCLDGFDAPAVFKGDLNYYTVEHDLTDQAKHIDTTQTALYVLTGEYDWSSTPAMGEALAAAVAGASFQMMPGLGHFPMCEDPVRFRSYIQPVLDEIRGRW